MTFVLILFWLIYKFAAIQLALLGSGNVESLHFQIWERYD